MLDFDLAQLYEVETRVFNQAIKRNLQSFPKDFMFRLTVKEWKNMMSQIVISSDLNNKQKNSSQFVMSSIKHRGANYLPYAFTEHGVSMAASVLKSTKARKMNIAIVRAFIAFKRFVIQNHSLTDLMQELKQRIDEHDVQLKHIYDTLENLLDEKEEEKVKQISWKERTRIGFK